jgi:hypothetical protein
MDLSPDKLRVLEVLAEELLKDEPQEGLVQKCFTEVGLPDNKDPIDRINKVLMALHFEDHKKEILE